MPLAEIAQSQVLSPVPMRMKGVEIASCASQLGTIVQPTNANLNVNVRSMLSVFCINAYYNAVSNVAHALATSRSGEVIPGNVAQPPFSM